MAMMRNAFRSIGARLDKVSQHVRRGQPEDDYLHRAMSMEQIEAEVVALIKSERDPDDLLDTFQAQYPEQAKMVREIWNRREGSSSPSDG